MDLDLLLGGLINTFKYQNLLAICIGNLIGLIFGALPGLTASLAIAVLIPVTFGMDPATGLLLLASAYCGAFFGGAISSILINTPGTVAAAATAIEGYKMALNGRGGQALAMSAYASFGGGIISTLALLFFGPPIAAFALKFGPAEYTALGVLGLVIIVSISMDSLVKGLLSGLLGIIIGTVGADAVTGYPRFTFGVTNLLGGIDLLSALIGFFSVSQILILAEKKAAAYKFQTIDRIGLSLKTIKENMAAIVRGSVIGTLIGALPGAGASIATFLSYDIAKRRSKHPEKYGHGAIEGVAACESADNGVTGGAFITMLTLGIPGNEATAIMMGGLMVLGLRPGPSFFVEGGPVAYTFIAGLLMGNLIMLISALLLSRYIAKLVKCPNEVLIAVIVILSTVGSYSINNSMFDVMIMFCAGLIGYGMKKTGFSPVPTVLGMILGPIIESNLHNALLLSRGSWLTFFQRPISLVFISSTIFLLIWPFISQKRAFKKAQRN